MTNNQNFINTLFNFMSVKGVGPVQTNRLLLSLNEFTALTLQDFALKLLDGNQKQEFENIKDQTLELKTKFEVDFIVLQEEDYPKEVKAGLSTNAPPVLTTIGNKELLKKKKVAFSGSRKVSEKGIEITKSGVTSLVKEDVAIVSGYANGVDLEAHYTALQQGGSTIIVLPEGINYFRIKKELKEVWDWDRILVISEFQPTERWMASRAMKRNSTIIALSDAVIVVEAGTTGGSIAAGNKTIEMQKPLFVPQYGEAPNSAEGNNILLKSGAQPLKMSRETRKPNMNKIIDSLGEQSYLLF